MSTDLNTRAEGILSLGADLHARKIYLMSEITMEMAGRTVIALDVLNEFDGDIEVIISSGGGDVTAGLVIYDALRSSPCSITTVAMGEVASTAALILQAGDKRVMTPNAVLMVHNIAASLASDLSPAVIRARAAETDRLNDRTIEIFLDAIGGDDADDSHTNTVVQWFNQETYFEADEALVAKLVDEVRS